ncbi:MAG TPA: CHC2 zinc finger domain-containing protein, partial [Accumulibacter sp.]|nr:CHC2 zinc finger domain-containing protein [Accumulibacter sp.]
MIPDSFIQGLLQRIDIVDLIDAHVPLKKAGANFVACCPFHAEKTPSFTVSFDKQFYHCFGCGAGGDVIAFIQAR